MNWPKHCEADRDPVSTSGLGWPCGHKPGILQGSLHTHTQLSRPRGPVQLLGPHFPATSLDAPQLQPWPPLSRGTHSFILLGRVEALFLDSGHVEHVSVGQCFLNALKFLLEGEAEPE